MIRIIAADEDKEKDSKDSKQEKVSLRDKKERKEPREKESKKSEKSEPAEQKEPQQEKLTAKNYFNSNPNFKFQGFINDSPSRDFTIKEPGKKGLINFVKEVIFSLKNRKAPIVVARIEGNNLSVNPNPPIQKSYNTSVNPRGFMLGIINELGNLGIRCNNFVSLYDYAKGKLNPVVEDILEKKITTTNYEISKIEGVEKLSDVIGTLNSSRKLQTAMEAILTSYNNYVDMYGRYLLNLINTKIKE